MASDSAYDASGEPQAYPSPDVGGVRIDNLVINDKPSTPLPKASTPVYRGDEEDDVFCPGNDRNTLFTGDVSNIVPAPRNRQRNELQLIHNGSPERAVQPEQHNVTDAQLEYPPSSCIFVANLPQDKDDQELEAAIIRVFDEFGPLFIKIRRDRNNMPFAFVQYTRDDAAKAALERGRGRDILGRPCRTERVKANNCAFYVYRRDGKDVTVAEAYELMHPFGRIAKAESLHHQIQGFLGLKGKAILVNFAFYDPRRDMKAALAGDDVYVVESLNQANVKDATNWKMQADNRRADYNFIRRYEVDRRTIWIGNLPLHITEDQIYTLVAECGPTEKVVIKRQNAESTPKPKAYAFVEFARPEATNVAIAALDKTLSADGNSVLAVQRKRVPKPVTDRHQSHFISSRKPAIVDQRMETPVKGESPGFMQLVTPENNECHNQGSSASHSPVQVEKPNETCIASPVSPITTVAAYQGAPAAHAPTPYGYPQVVSPIMTPHGGMIYPGYPYQPSPYTYQTPYWDPANYYAAWTSPYMPGSYAPTEIPAAARQAYSEPGNGRDDHSNGANVDKSPINA